MFDPDGDIVKCRNGDASLSECSPCTPPSVLSLSPVSNSYYSFCHTGHVGINMNPRVPIYTKSDCNEFFNYFVIRSLPSGLMFLHHPLSITFALCLLLMPGPLLLLLP